MKMIKLLINLFLTLVFFSATAQDSRELKKACIYMNNRQYDLAFEALHKTLITGGSFEKVYYWNIMEIVSRFKSNGYPERGNGTSAKKNDLRYLCTFIDTTPELKKKVIDHLIRCGIDTMWIYEVRDNFCKLCTETELKNEKIFKDCLKINDQRKEDTLTDAQKLKLLFKEVDDSLVMSWQPALQQRIDESPDTSFVSAEITFSHVGDCGKDLKIQLTLYRTRKDSAEGFKEGKYTDNKIAIALTSIGDLMRVNIKSYSSIKISIKGTADRIKTKLDCKYNAKIDCELDDLKKYEIGERLYNPDLGYLRAYFAYCTLIEALSPVQINNISSKNFETEVNEKEKGDQYRKVICSVYFIDFYLIEANALLDKAHQISCENMQGISLKDFQAPVIEFKTGDK